MNDPQTNWGIKPALPQPESDEWFEALGDMIEKHPIVGAHRCN